MDMGTKTVVTLLVAGGIVGGFSALLWPGNLPSPAGTALHPVPLPSPSSSSIWIAADTVSDSLVAVPASSGSLPFGHRRLPRKRVAQVDVDYGNLLRAQIQAAMQSEFPANQDRINSWLAEWTQHDPAAAGRFASSLSAGAWRKMTLRQVAQVWTAQDAAGAERWAARLPDEDERASMMAAVCFQVAQSDARSAVEIAERHGLETVQGEVRENLVQQWSEQDATGAAAWISEQPAGEGRDKMVGRLAYVQSQTEPAAAANLVVEQMPTGPIQDEAVISVLHQWALRDPVAAADWVNRFPAGALRDRAQAELRGLAEYARP